jgi:purine-binding chemotaxis protein CheW
MSTTALSTQRQQQLAAQVERHSFVTMRVNGQLFGASVQTVQDVVREQTIAPMPLAPNVIEGALNLRGRIITVLNLYRRLGLPLEHMPEKHMHVVIENRDELYSLMVDCVGDVLSLPLQDIDKVPVNLEAAWREIAAGIYRLDEELLVLLDINELLNFHLDN